MTTTVNGNKQRIIVIAGPSGSGKGSALKALPAGYKKAVSVTTRKIRQNEIPDVSYKFITQKEFDDMEKSGELLESNNFDSRTYGVRRSQIASILEEGLNVVLDIDVNGAASVKKHYPDAVLIFLMSPNAAIQKVRLERRDENTAESVRARLEAAKEEIARVGEFDCVIVNEENAAEDATDAVNAILKFLDGKGYDEKRAKYCIDNYFKEIQI